MPLSQILIEGEGWKESKGAIREKSSLNYQVHPEGMGIFRIATGGKKELVYKSDRKLTCLTVWRNGGTLVAGGEGSRHLLTFRITEEGKLTDTENYYRLRVRPGRKTVKVLALTMDRSGRMYALTPIGIQVFDTTGRFSGLILLPTRTLATDIAFIGEDQAMLAVMTNKQMYVRKLKTRGVPLQK